MKTYKQMAQYSHIMTQNIILWINRDHTKIKKFIAFIYKLKIYHEYSNDNYIANFILSPYGALIPLYIHTNPTNMKVNIKFCCFQCVYIFFTLVSSTLLGQKLYYTEFIIEYYANFRENDRFLMLINVSKPN
eukprot:36364_1